MQTSNASVFGLSEMGEEPTCPDELSEVLQLASQYSSTKNYGKLDILLDEVQRKYEQKVLLINEKFVLALIDSKLHRKEFREVYRIIEKLERITSAEKLISIWNEAHYEEEEINIGRHLTSVMKYRVRARFPPPPNVRPSGKPLSLRLSKSSTAILKRWSSDHNAKMPAPENIESLTREANLTFEQVKNWFRRSLAKCKKEQAEKLSSRSQNPTAAFSLCLQSAAANLKTKQLFEDGMESPSKYLKKDDPKCCSLLENLSVPPPRDVKSTIVQGSDVLEFKDEDLIGYVPAYCIRTSGVHPTNNPIVMFDARSIHKQIPNVRSTEGEPVCGADIAATYTTVTQADSTFIEPMTAEALKALQEM